VSTQSTPRQLLIIEDDNVTRALLVSLLSDQGYAVTAAPDGEAGIEALERGSFDIVLLDVNLPGMQGLDVLELGVAMPTAAQFVMMTAFSSIQSAVRAMRLGAFDYLTKPLRTDELMLVLERALQNAELRREVVSLRSKLVQTGLSGLVGPSPPMTRLFELVERVAPTRATVLITGETGTGKELVARAIHDLSERASRPFVPVNCSALPESLLESELFGHVKGSFTGALADRRGLFEEAAGGTLFLDEVSTISPAIQVKLLRVIQERAVRRVGGSGPIPTDFRLIAASNQDLAEAVEAGTFREDLYYRLNVYPIRTPPLRERLSDIPVLVDHFVSRLSALEGLPRPSVPRSELERLAGYHWPGNVRELENLIQRAIILHAGGGDLRFDLHVSPLTKPSAVPSLDQAAEEGWSLDRLEREYIMRVLEKTRHHKGHAAEILRLDRRTLYRKVREYGAADGAGEGAGADEYPDLVGSREAADAGSEPAV
jgi:DNA-binding NtrC family response regulator